MRVRGWGLIFVLVVGVLTPPLLFLEKCTGSAPGPSSETQRETESCRPQPLCRAYVNQDDQLVPAPPPPSSLSLRPDKPEPGTKLPSTVDEALEHLRAANVAFNTPEKARVGRQFVVEAKLSTHLRLEEMRILIGEPGKREIATLKVSDRMTATLSGGSAFEVTPNGPQEQWISDKETTEWNWQITPKSVGEQILILGFDALISLNGKEDKRTINTFKRRISVDVGWPETTGEGLEFIKKTGENVSWIWATLLIPIGGGIWTLIKRRNQRSEPERTPPSD